MEGPASRGYKVTGRHEGQVCSHGMKGEGEGGEKKGEKGEEKGEEKGREGEWREGEG